MTADKPAKPSRSPRKRVQAWVREAADRAEGKAAKEPILDREDKVRTLAAVKDARKRAAEAAGLSPQLPTLSKKHLAFVKAIVTGQANNATEAYVVAYGKEHASRQSLFQKASGLMSMPKIQEWLSAYRMAALDDMLTTADRHIAQLARIRELALAAGDYKAAGVAEVSRGKVSGLYQSTLVVEHRANDVALVDALTKTLGAETAAQLARALGVSSLPGDTARPMVLDHATGETPVSVDGDEDDKAQG